MSSGEPAIMELHYNVVAGGQIINSLARMLRL